MNEFLVKIIDAHGGTDRWHWNEKVEATIMRGGGFFALNLRERMGVSPPIGNWVGSGFKRGHQAVCWPFAGFGHYTQRRRSGRRWEEQ